MNLQPLAAKNAKMEFYVFLCDFCTDVHGRTNVAGAWSAGATFAAKNFFNKILEI
jgi:hypothetical protein